MLYFSILFRNFKKKIQNQIWKCENRRVQVPWMYLHLESPQIALKLDHVYRAEHFFAY